MSTDMSGEQMQAKIAAARRDAEGLKDKIKRKKDELADTSCKAPGGPEIWLKQCQSYGSAAWGLEL